MTFTVSKAAVEALQPASLPGDVSLIGYDGTLISWPAHGDASEGGKRTIKTQDVVLLAEIAGGGYLILTLTEGQPGEEGQEEPFRLSAVSAAHLPQGLLDQLLLHDLPGFLRGVAGSSLHVIVSAGSGTGLAPKFYDAVLRPLLETLGLSSSSSSSENDEASYRTTLTKDANTVKEFAKAELGGSVGGTAEQQQQQQTVILLSGDGAVVDLLNGASDTPHTTDHHILPPTIVLVPLGTGNALFHSLHKPHYDSSSSPSPTPLALALRALLRGRAAPLPTFRAAFSPGARLVEGSEAATGPPVAALTGAIVASYGLHSQLVWESDTPAWRRHGAARFGMVAEALLRESHAYRAVVETMSSISSSPNDVDVDDGGEAGFNYILATLVSSLERTFTISPASRPLDGTLRVVRFGGRDGPGTMEVMLAAYDGGRHVGLPGVRYEAVNADGGDGGEGEDGGWVRVTTREADARWRKVCVDGTIVELPEGGSMTVRRAAGPGLRVVVLDA